MGCLVTYLLKGAISGSEANYLSSSLQLFFLIPSTQLAFPSPFPSPSTEGNQPVNIRVLMTEREKVVSKRERGKSSIERERKTSLYPSISSIQSIFPLINWYSSVPSWFRSFLEGLACRLAQNGCCDAKSESFMLIVTRNPSRHNK